MIRPLGATHTIDTYPDNLGGMQAFELDMDPLDQPITTRPTLALTRALQTLPRIIPEATSPNLYQYPSISFQAPASSLLPSSFARLKDDLSPIAFNVAQSSLLPAPSSNHSLSI
jgi:hypothetical protein